MLQYETDPKAGTVIRFDWRGHPIKLLIVIEAYVSAIDLPPTRNNARNKISFFMIVLFFRSNKNNYLKNKKIIILFIFFFHYLNKYVNI